MDSELSQLKNYLYRNPSFMSIYEEAVKNSLDAESTQIEIVVREKSKVSDAELTILDNGNGFNQESFNRFSVLGKKVDGEHKGLGRVVYLMYYGEVNIISNYRCNGEWLRRNINFNDTFNPKDSPDEFKEEGSNQEFSQTKLIFRRPIHQKIHDGKFINIYYIRSFLFARFLPEFYARKQNGQDIVIIIKDGESDIGGNMVTLSSSDFPSFDTKDIDMPGTKLFNGANPRAKILYTVEKNYQSQYNLEENIITAISVDGRSFEVDIIDSLPQGCRVIFLLYSEEIIFKSTPDRSGLDIDSDLLKRIEKIFRTNVVKIIEERIPEIETENKNTIRNINKKYPFLIGYLEGTGVTLCSSENLIASARIKYENEKKDLLDLQGLSDAQFNSALEISSRLLTEYILYRQIIINKIDTLCKNNENNETLLHNIIIPRRNINDGADINFEKNNIWLLDDKFMSFSTVLSDRSVTELLQKLGDSNAGNNDRPDIAIVFSKDEDSKQQSSSDVVIIELKGQNPHKNDLPILVQQITDRAKALTEKYPDRINRIWYYGVLGLNENLKRRLIASDRFRRMFSNDEYWYGQDTFIPDYVEVASESDRMQVDFFLLSYNALVADAKSRNSAFLNMLRKHIISAE